MKITQTGIAEACGVSFQVVSAILNGKDPKLNARYGEETRKKVLETAEKLGYQRNRTARNLVRKRHGQIGIITDRIYMLPHILQQGIIDEAKKHDCLVTIESYNPENGDVPLVIRENCVDGVILLKDLSPDIRKRIPDNFPVVYFNTNERRNAGSIIFDEIGALNMVAAKFAGNGRKNPAYLCHEERSDTHYSFVERRRVFPKACLKHGLRKPLEFLLEPGWDLSDLYEDRINRLRSFLEENSDVDCILMASSAFAGILGQACMQIGKKLPVDLDVAGFEWGHDERITCPWFTGLHMSYYRLGVASVVKLDRMINGEKVEPEKYEYLLSEPLL